jgi:hypothetical protein
MKKSCQGIRKSHPSQESRQKSPKVAKVKKSRQSKKGRQGEKKVAKVKKSRQGEKKSLQ